MPVRPTAASHRSPSARNAAASRHRPPPAENSPACQPVHLPPTRRPAAGGSHSSISQLTVNPSKFTFGFPGTRNVNRCPTRATMSFGNIHSASVAGSVAPAKPAPAVAESASPVESIYSFPAPFGHQFPESRQAVVPEPFIQRNPIPHRSKPLRHKVIPPLAPVPLLGHKPGIQQNAKMLRNRRPAHLEMPGDRADRTIARNKKIQRPPPRGMADRSKNIGLAIWRRDHASIIRKEMLTCQVGPL